MNKSKRHIVIALWLVLLGQMVHSLYAQTEFGGKPFNITKGLAAEDVMYVLPPPDPMDIESRLLENQRSGMKVLNYAVERDLGLSPEDNGSWLEHNGYRIWRIHIVSPEATSLGVICEPFELLDGARLFIYGPDEQDIRGAYSALNNTPTGVLPLPHIQGDEVIVELQVPLHQADFCALGIKSVSHAFITDTELQVLACPGDYRCSQYCEVDINC